MAAATTSGERAEWWRPTTPQAGSSRGLPEHHTLGEVVFHNLLLRAAEYGRDAETPSSVGSLVWQLGQLTERTLCKAVIQHKQITNLKTLYRSRLRPRMWASYRRCSLSAVYQSLMSQYMSSLLRLVAEVAQTHRHIARLADMQQSSDSDSSDTSAQKLNGDSSSQKRRSSTHGYSSPWYIPLWNHSYDLFHSIEHEATGALSPNKQCCSSAVGKEALSELVEIASDLEETVRMHTLVVQTVTCRDDERPVDLVHEMDCVTDELERMVLRMDRAGCRLRQRFPTAAPPYLPLSRRPSHLLPAEADYGQQAASTISNRLSSYFARLFTWRRNKLPQ